MGGEHGCAVAKLQVSEVSSGQQGSEVTFEFYASTSAPGRIRTCAHGSGGRCCMTLLPGKTCRYRPVGECMGGAQDTNCRTGMEPHPRPASVPAGAHRGQRRGGAGMRPSVAPRGGAGVWGRMAQAQTRPLSAAALGTCSMRSAPRRISACETTPPATHPRTTHPCQRQPAEGGLFPACHDPPQARRRPVRSSSPPSGCGR